MRGVELCWGSAWQTGQLRLRAEERVALHLLQSNLTCFFLSFVCSVLLFNRRKKVMLMYAKKFIILKRSLNAVCL